LLDESWLPVPMLVLGLTLVFGLTEIDAPPGVVTPTPGVEVWAAAGPMPMMNVASDAAAMDTYPCFMLDPPEGLSE
jgi:hypothetical protein